MVCLPLHSLSVCSLWFKGMEEKGEEGEILGLLGLDPKAVWTSRVKANPGENGRFCCKTSPQSIWYNFIARYSCEGHGTTGEGVGTAMEAGTGASITGENHMEAISRAFIQKSIKVLVALRLKWPLGWDHNSPTLNTIYPADVHFIQKYQLTTLKN